MARPPHPARRSLSHSISGSATPEVSYGTTVSMDMSSVTASLSRPTPRSLEDDNDGAKWNGQHIDDLYEDETATLTEATPYGVRKMSAISATLSKRQLAYLYSTVLIISVVVSLESQCTNGIEPYFLSQFSAHALLSTVAVVTSIAFAVGKIPLAQVLDQFGRPEGLAFAAGLYAVGYILTSFSNTFALFAIARVLASLGAQGLQLAQQVLIADTSTLSNRALLTSVISLPWMFTIWLGPLLTQGFLALGPTGYRLAYGLFGLVVPLLCAPLILALWWHHRRLVQARAERLQRPGSPLPGLRRSLSPAVSRTTRRVISVASIVTTQTTMSWLDRDADSLAAELWRELDATGLLLLTFSCTTFLLPLSLAATRPEAWSAAWIWASFACSIFSAYVLLWHERRADKPILPPRLLQNRTLMAGCGLGLFHFACQFTYESYFSSYLQVARQRNVIEAQYISQSYIFAACIAALVAGLLCKWTRRYKIWGVFGVLAHIAGAVLMLQSRKPGTPTASLVWAQLIGGVGGGFTTLCAQLGIQASVVHDDLARATAAFLTITTLGGAVGGACAGAIWSSSLPGRLREYLPSDAQGEIDSIIGSLAVALSFPPGSPTRIGIERAYSEVQHILNTVALLALVPALLCMLAMHDVTLTDTRNPESEVLLGSALVLDDDASVHSVDSERSALLPAHS